MLLLNIGNTHTQIARSDGSCVGAIQVIPTGEVTPALIAGESAAIASVVPEVSARLRAPGVFFLERSMAAACGVDLSCVDASTLGMDRLANAIELGNRELPAAALDAGTALTLEYVDAKRVFRGGAIAPGRRMMRRSLAEGTAQLPEIALAETAPEAPGRDTASAIRFGVDRGIVGMAEAWLAALPGVTVYAVGGDAPFFLRALPALVPGGDDFTLRGLLTAWQRCR